MVEPGGQVIGPCNAASQTVRLAGGTRERAPRTSTPDGNATVPIFDLQFAVAEGRPGHLAERLATLTD
jgi:hypothetical protein